LNFETYTLERAMVQKWSYSTNVFNNIQPVVFMEAGRGGGQNVLA